MNHAEKLLKALCAGEDVPLEILKDSFEEEGIPLPWYWTENVEPFFNWNDGKEITTLCCFLYTPKHPRPVRVSNFYGKVVPQAYYWSVYCDDPQQQPYYHEGCKYETEAKTKQQLQTIVERKIVELIRKGKIKL